MMHKQPYRGQQGDVYHPAPTTNMFFQSEFASERGSIAKSEFAEPAKDVRLRPQSIISMDKRREILSKFSESDQHAILSQNPSIELTEKMSESLFTLSNQTLRASEKTNQHESLKEIEPSESN
jgi:hypothetical protein